MISRFRVKPLYKLNAEIVNEDVKWNRSDKVYIEEIIKIKMSEFDISSIYNLNICQESIYFIGLKNF